MSNIEIEDVTILLGARYDKFDVEAEDIAVTLLNNPWSDLGKVSDSVGEWSYNVSLSYRSESGFVPYATYAVANSLNANQLGGVIPRQFPQTSISPNLNWQRSGSNSLALTIAYMRHSLIMTKRKPSDPDSFLRLRKRFPRG